MQPISRLLMVSVVAAAANGLLALGTAAQDQSAADQKSQKIRPKLPSDLVYLRDVAPTIIEDMRYATARNFTGAPLPGYFSGACILRRGAAQALRRAQADLMSMTPPLSLIVYDCYRPMRAVRAMVRWSKRATNPELKNFYFPKIEKRKLFSSGYISARSAHSTGSTVDLSIVNVSREAKSASANGRKSMGSCVDGGSEPGTQSAIDMGTAYDCFDVKSHTWNGSITAAQIRNRKTLLQAMSRQGFSNYKREWWHFTHRASRSKRRFDVPIQ